jgi:hypothetical protein
MTELNSIDKFGKFLVENLRDRGIQSAEFLLENKWKAPSLQELQLELSKLSDAQKGIVMQTVTQSIDTAIHDFLFAIQEKFDFDNDIQIFVDNQNIVELSDGVHGEAYTDEGWNAKFSKYGYID